MRHPHHHPPRAPREPRDTGQIAARLGVPVHLVDATLEDVQGALAALPAGHPDLLVRLRRALVRLCVRAFDVGTAKGARDAVARAVQPAADAGRAWYAALARRAGAGEPFGPPTAAEVAAAWAASGAGSVVGECEVRAACAACGLPLAAAGV